MFAIRQLRHVLFENQIMIVFLALILGLVVPEPFKPLNAYSTQLLIIVFFASSLRLSWQEIRRYVHDWRLIGLAVFFMLIVLPLALFAPLGTLGRFTGSQDLETWALALLILGAMPTGMTIALIADFMGGVTSLALVITAATSLLAPLTVPIVFKIAIGRIVPIPILSMFWSLCLTIVIPFVLAMISKRAAPRFVTRYGEVFRVISVLAFGALIAGIVSDTSGDTLLHWTQNDLLIAIGSILWLGALTWVVYAIPKHHRLNERITLALSMVYLNNTLSLFIADRFFHDTNVMPKLLLLLIAVNALLPPIKWEAKRALT